MNDQGNCVAAEAPANIALIKYMGKRVATGKDAANPPKNVPTNSSLSYTLNHLRTRVEITEINDGNYDEWHPLECEGWKAPTLSDHGRQRFLTHFQFLKQKFGLRGVFEVKSANNFPADCGIASSASSFAALTMAAYKLAELSNSSLDFTWPQLAELSRVGSGSSIRSFYGPFAIWTATGCQEWQEGPRELLHQVVLVDADKKSVSSSEAHKRVNTSLVFDGRPERAEKRLLELQEVLRAPESTPSKLNWRRAYEIAGAEFWDMHGLFHTARPPFRYINAQSLQILELVDALWEQNGDGPIVTLDAGPNVHLLYRADQKDLLYLGGERLTQFNSKLKILSSV